MTVHFDCPSCGASIRVHKGIVSVICKGCGNSVHVPHHICGHYDGITAAKIRGRSFDKSLALIVAVAVMLLIGISVMVLHLRIQGEDRVVESPSTSAVISK